MSASRLALLICSLLDGRTAVRLLWVISGHVRLHEKASALPLKEDIQRGGRNSTNNVMSIAVPSSELIAATSEYPSDTHAVFSLVSSSVKRERLELPKLPCAVSRQTDN
jgi:hypothetical protein